MDEQKTNVEMDLEKLRVQKVTLIRALEKAINTLDSIAFKISSCDSSEKRKAIHDLAYTGDLWNVLKSIKDLNCSAVQRYEVQVIDELGIWDS
jgi:hypothetical protein